MRPSMPMYLGGFFVALTLVACADEKPTASTASVMPLTPSATGPPAPPPTFAPPTPEPTFAPIDSHVGGSSGLLPPPGRTPTPERPSSRVHPPGTRTGLAEVDPVLEALESRDLDALMAVVALTEVRCGDSEFT